MSITKRQRGDGRTDLFQSLLVLLLEPTGGNDDIQPEVLALFALTLPGLLEARELRVYATFITESLAEVLPDALYITVEVPTASEMSVMALTM